jgi:hypothetical protein
MNWVCFENVQQVFTGAFGQSVRLGQFLAVDGRGCKEQVEASSPSGTSATGRCLTHPEGARWIEVKPAEHLHCRFALHCTLGASDPVLHDEVTCNTIAPPLRPE